MTHDAGELFARYAREVSYAVRQAARLLPDRAAIDYDDIRQEALICLAAYAGLMPGSHAGKLAEWEALGDEPALRRYLCSTLRADLVQIISRRIAPESPLPLDELPEGAGPAAGFEQALADHMARAEGIRALYPFLCRSVLDGMTEAQIARESGVTRHTVINRLAAERAALAASAPAAALCTRSANSRGALGIWGWRCPTLSPALP